MKRRSSMGLLSGLMAAATLPLGVASAASQVCAVQSGAQLTPVIELYTSEGCSSCPPADRWLSGLKDKPVVALAFHVAYWDYIGWKDRFAQPAFSSRQKEIAALNGLTGIYTPQLVRNGRDWRDYDRAAQTTSPARATISLQRLGASDTFEARITPVATDRAWTAHWSVTEDGHSSRVKAGENSGEFLKHDFVVRQFTPVGQYRGAQVLQFFAIASQPEHPRRVNLVVSDAQTGEPLQGVSLPCT